MLGKTEEERRAEKERNEIRKSLVEAAFWNGIGTAGGLAAFAAIAGFVAKVMGAF